MVEAAGTAFGISVFAFIALLAMVRAERRRGRRFFAGGVRGWCDVQCDRSGQWVLRSWDHFVKYVVQLNWYYSIHGVLRTMLRAIVAVYTRFEDVFERNRARTKQLRKEKRELSELNHLRQMTEHKAETALTAAEKRKLNKKGLEGKL